MFVGPVVRFAGAAPPGGRAAGLEWRL